MTDMRSSLTKFRVNFGRKLIRLRQRIFNSDNRLISFLALLGPGIIAASSGNEASGIATYSTAGAEYGYTLLWAFIPMTICFIAAQEMCVRMGVVTGKGLSDLIRERFGVRWTTLIMFALLIANFGIIVAQFVGIAQASELLGVSRYFRSVTALMVWWLVVKGTPKTVEQIFLLMSLVFLTYIFQHF